MLSFVAASEFDQIWDSLPRCCSGESMELLVGRMVAGGMGEAMPEWAKRR
jgi:hypothetical protein